MILLGTKTENDLGVELLIPIVVLIHSIRNPRGMQWKLAMIMVLVVGLAMLPKTSAFLKIKNPLNEANRAKLNPNPPRSGAYGMGTKLSLQQAMDTESELGLKTLKLLEIETVIITLADTNGGVRNSPFNSSGDLCDTREQFALQCH